ncbi:MFS transporter [Perlabentimonas gracilis]|uniref:MFS transporter n=1 Tax=Perlabentimonas gracilis TaxID=2715279 RepID=UPI00140C0950|nr:MFS transporter [Perlabentimonas gracilis]NHB69908.1 MFS transporter [Perlabentimonas gracilis]
MTNKPTFWTKDFVMLTVANLLMAIAFYFMLPVLPIYLVDKLSVSKGEVGTILAFYTIAALMIRPFSGWAIDTFGRKKIYLIAFLLFSTSYVIYPIASGVTAFLAIRYFHGLTWGTLTTTSSTIAVDIIPPSRRGEGIGIFGLSMTIGMAIGPMIAILITGDTRFNSLFASAIVISLLGFILALIIKYPKFRSQNNSKGFSWNGLIEKTALPVSTNMMLVMFTYGGVLSFIALYAKDIGVQSSGLFFLLLSVGIGLSRVGSGRLIDKQGPSAVSVIGIILLVAGFPILALIQTPLGFHTAALILGLGYGMIMPTFQTMVNNIAPANRRGAANSSFFTAFDLGIGLGMIGTGILSQWLGFGHTFIISSAMNLAALTLFGLSTIKHYQNHYSKPITS